MTLRRVAEVKVNEGVIGQYVHNAVGEGLGKIGVIVGLESSGDKGALATLGRQIAMHVAAASPLALDSASIDPAVIDREKGVLAEKNAGKPAHVLEKIVDSGLKTFYKEVALLDQAYIHDGGKTVSQTLKESEKTVGAPIGLTGFARFALGEGVDKGDTPDFASEVASMV
jgi:elongation factor Ts